MFIIIHRTECSEIRKIYEYLVETLPNEVNSVIEVNKKWITVGVENTRIDFYCGDYSRMAGIRPDYYNTDNETVAYFLQMMADRVNGKEIKDISELINIIKGGINGNSRSDKI
jgi:hypothetical protein